MTTIRTGNSGLTPLRIAVLLVVWLASMSLALVVGAYAYKYRANIRSLMGSVQTTEIVETNLYILKKEKIAVEGNGRDGGIAALGDGLLYVSRDGKSWFVNREKKLHSLKLRVPVNAKEFETDPYNNDTVGKDRFGVKDVYVLATGVRLTILASYTYWYAEKRCYALRVSVLDMTLDKLMAGAGSEAKEWHTAFETTPCRTLNMLRGGKLAVTLGAGGRIAPLPGSGFLLSVGGFGAESEAVENGSAEQALENDSYGKTILFDLATGVSRIYSRGHRNPQGLATGSDSRVWSTEHGPKGGDELNLILDGKDYGWPHVTYGTEYEMLTWPENPHQGRHEGFEKPMYVWIPSIGVSQLIVVERDAFPFWKGDLLVASLNGMTLYRVRIEEGRAIFAEPIPVGHRVRDVAETVDGSIALKTDDDFLIYFEPASTAAAGGSINSALRGKILASQCRSCHTFNSGGEHRIGPNLWGVVGRRIASSEGYRYSEGLQAARLKLPKGRWTPEALRSYLGDPQRFAPGNTMEMATLYSDAELSDLITYLETLE